METDGGEKKNHIQMALLRKFPLNKIANLTFSPDTTHPHIAMYLEEAITIHFL